MQSVVLYVRNGYIGYAFKLFGIFHFLSCMTWIVEFKFHLDIVWASSSNPKRVPLILAFTILKRHLTNGFAVESESSLVSAAILMYAIVILSVFSLFRQLNQMKSRSQYIYLTPPMPLFPLNVYKLDYAFITRAYAFPLTEYSWLQRVLPTIS